MKKPTIYVAGPVPREKEKHDVLRSRYRQLEKEADRAGIDVHMPYEDMRLSTFNARSFADEIRGRIIQSDAIIVMLVPPSSLQDMSNVSVGCEAQTGAAAGKPLVIVTDKPKEVPRLVGALSRREPYLVDKVDYQQLFRELFPPRHEERARTA